MGWRPRSGCTITNGAPAVQPRPLGVLLPAKTLQTRTATPTGVMCAASLAVECSVLMQKSRRGQHALLGTVQQKAAAVKVSGGNYCDFYAGSHTVQCLQLALWYVASY
jgi:hypothetical protein